MFARLSRLVGGRTHRKPITRSQRTRLGLEALDDRVMSAAHTWTGAVSSSWTNAANWAGNSSPIGDLSADVYIPGSASVQYDYNFANGERIQSLNFTGFGSTLSSDNPSLHYLTITGDVTAAAVTGRSQPENNWISVPLAFGLPTAVGGQHNLNVGSGSVLNITSGISSNNSGQPLHKMGQGTAVLSGINTYTDYTYIDAGTVRSVRVNAIPTTTEVIMAAGATLDLNGYDDSIADLDGNGQVNLGSAHLSIGDDDTTHSFSGNIAGTGSVSISTRHTYNLSGQLTYTGPTDLLGGYFAVHNTASIPNSMVYIHSGAELSTSGSVQHITVMSGGFLDGPSARMYDVHFQPGAGFSATAGFGFTPLMASVVDLSGRPSLSLRTIGVYPGQTVSLVQTGLLSGVFNGLADGAIFQGWDLTYGLTLAWYQIHYTPTSVTVTRIA